MSGDAIFGSDHNKKSNKMLHLVFLRSNPDKRELVCGVEISYLMEIHKTKINRWLSPSLSNNPKILNNFLICTVLYEIYEV